MQVSNKVKASTHAVFPSTLSCLTKKLIIRKCFQLRQKFTTWPCSGLYVAAMGLGILERKRGLTWSRAIRFCRVRPR